MTVNYTTNLALGQPVTGTESGTWGDDVNNAVTSYLDIAIAGGLAVTVTTADVTLTLTQGTSVATNIGSTTAQYAILNVSGAMTAARNLILPSSSRQYVINNACTGGFLLTVKGSATTGVTLVNGEKAHVFWTGTDYSKLSNTPGGAGTFSSITNTGLTSGRVVFSTSGGLETDSAGLTFDGTNFATTGTATAAKLIPTGNSATGNGLYLPAANSVGLSTNGTNAVYINSSQNIGVGTSAPAAKLDVAGGASTTAFAVHSNSNGVLPSTTPAGLVISQNYGGGSGGAAEIDFFFNDSTFVGDNGGFRFYQKTGASTAQEMLRLTQNTVIAYTGGTEQMRITSAGLVGIGTNSPAYKLDVAGAISTNNNLTFTSTGNRITGDFSNGTVANRVMFQSSTVNGASRVGIHPNGTSAAAEMLVLNNSDTTNAGFGSIRMNASDFQITSTFNGAGTYLPMTFYTGGSERIRIDTSGNVGIGNSSPTAKLDVTGGINLSGQLLAGTSGSVYSPIVSAAYVSGTSNLYMRNLAGVNRIDSYNDPITATYPFQLNASQITFYIADVEKMRIDSSGNLTVGTTNSAPGNGSGNNVAGFSANANGTTWASRSGFEALSVNRIDTTGGVLRAASAGNQVGGISVTSSATAFNTSSDYRLKQDVAPMTGALIKVAALKPVTYKWKRDGSDGEGFIAHELAEVCPQAVTGAKDAVDADGNPEHQGIDTSFLVATLTAAIQEQQALITSLTARITALEST